MSLEQEASALQAKLKTRANQVVSQGLSSRDVPLTLQEGVAIMDILDVVVQNQIILRDDDERSAVHVHAIVVNNKERETGIPK